MKNLILGFIVTTLLSGMAVAAVERDGRVAVVVVDLATHAPQERRFFYEWVEAAALAETKNRIKPLYRKVVLLHSSDATVRGFYAAISAEVIDPDTKAIDTYINLHGSPGTLSFFDATVSVKDIRAVLSTMKGSGGKLRALNSTACYGASHTGDWLGAGYKVASGSRKVNTNGAHDFPAFLKAWGGGETYMQAQDKGNDDRWIKFYDNMAAKWGINDIDSYKVVEGKSDYTISTGVIP